VNVKAPPPEHDGEFDVSGHMFRTGRFQLRQNPHILELWFSRGRHLPREHWEAVTDATTGITVFLSTRRVEAGWPVPKSIGGGKCPLVAGITVPFDHCVATYPVASLRLMTSDFK
jgi:hypothetical protein